MGSVGEKGRPFIQDFLQADGAALVSVMIGGVVFNLGNILLSAATSIAGMAVAFPLGVGLIVVAIFVAGLGMIVISGN